MYDSREGIEIRRRSKILTAVILILFLLFLIILTTGCSTLDKAFTEPDLELEIIIELVAVFFVYSKVGLKK